MSDPYTDEQLAMDKWTPNRIARAMGSNRPLVKSGPIVASVNAPIPPFRQPKSISDKVVARKTKLWGK